MKDAKPLTDEELEAMRERAYGDHARLIATIDAERSRHAAELRGARGEERAAIVKWVRDMVKLREKGMGKWSADDARGLMDQVERGEHDLARPAAT